MRAIILAAGQGTRLRPLTDDRPKCMVHYRGKPIIDHILESMAACAVNDITIVKGYREEVIDRPDCKSCFNERFATTNMVYTLFCAEAELEGDVIVSYGDIVYESAVLQRLLETDGDFVVVVDKGWRVLWEQRMENPLDDAETMKLTETGFITELGKRPLSYDDVQGQYIGLFKISAAAVARVRQFYHSLDRTAEYDGKDFNNMYMTTFIQLVIDNLMPVGAAFIHGGWLEIDSPADLKCEPLSFHSGGGLAHDSSH